jgi:NADPH:quinone reductase-like Zn-dependent oxidoreductase
MSGASFPPDAALGPLLFKRLTLKGSTLRSRDVGYQKQLLDKFEELALPKIVKGDMKVMVHDVLDWEKIQEAHKLMTENKNSGKVSSGGSCDTVAVSFSLIGYNR